MAVDVEHVFSQGRLVLSHLQNRLSAATIHASMCVGAWSKMGYVTDKDIEAVTVLDDVAEDADEEFDKNWAKI